MFCNGMVVLPDGRVFINGGTLQHPPGTGNGYDPFEGQNLSAIYDPSTGQFTRVQNMANGRWYPTVTNLRNGTVMTFSGLDENSNTNATVEEYTVGPGWSSPYPPSPFTPGLYPRMHLLPNGQIFMSGPTPTSYFFNPSSGWSSTGLNTYYGLPRVYGSSVLFPLSPADNYKPKVMIMGGGVAGGSVTDGATGNHYTEIIDLSAASPSWQPGPYMSQPRIEMNATILPNGKIIVLGGSTNDEDANSASLNADLYDPASNTFSSAGQSTTLCTGNTTNTQAPCYARLYHSNSLLLPDATVMLFGGNPQRGTYEPRIEIWTPPYLFNSTGTLAARPSITSVVPSGPIGYGAKFDVPYQTPSGTTITSVVLMRPGAPTHAFDMEQRMVVLCPANCDSAGSGVLNLTAPPNGNIAPPGYYLLFVLANGVPSVGQFVQLVAPANANLVQNASIDAGPTTSYPLAFPSDNTLGNWIGVVIRGGAPNETFTVSDTRLNTYQLATTFNQTADGDSGAIFFAENIKGGPNTVTVSGTASGTLRFAVVEFSGIAKSGSLDKTAALQGNNANPNTYSGSGSPPMTTADGDLLLGAIITADPESITGGGGYYIQQSVPSQTGAKLVAEYQIQPTAGPATASAVLGASSAWAAGLAAFKAAGSGGSTPNPPNITSLSPTSGPVGTTVTITGTNFGSTGTVTFNGITATTNWTTTVITTSVPTGATLGPGNVVVTVSGGGGSASAPFTVTTGGGGGGINLVQHTSKDAGVVASSGLAFGANNTAGNFIAVVIRAGGNPQTFGVTDSLGNSYKQAVQFVQSTDGHSDAIYYAENIKAGANTVTVTLTSNTLRFAILEFSGIATAGSIDIIASNQGNNNANPSTGSFNTNTNGELLLGAISSANADTYTAGPGYAIPENVANKLAVEWQVQLNAGPASASATLSPGDNWAAGVAAFKPAGSGGGGGAGGSISIQFVGKGFAMGISETAGVVPLSNWNTAQTANSSMGLVNSSGNATTATVSWHADDPWDETLIADQPGNVRMMRGYLDNGGCSPSSCGPQDTTTVTVSGLAPDAKGYTVYVYANGDIVSGSGVFCTGIYQISGTGINNPSVSLTYTNDFMGTFTPANNSVGNYVVFTIPNVSSFTLSAIPSTASSGYERAPLNGIQIIPN
jgi:hypothetical protein